MTRMATRIWWAQIKAVVRLEMRKTFFAKRGLWIYLVAALPVLIFMAYAVATSHQQSRREGVARQSTRRLADQDLMAVKTGMTSQEVVAILGKPPLNFHWTEHKPAETEKGESVEVSHEDYQYSDGQNDLYVGLVDGKVESINIQEGNNLGVDSIMFAGVFQFFFLRLAIFFGCLGIFMNLFRGEVLDRSLHFYFLAPIRREVLMAGKFLAGLLATCTIFVTSEVLQTIAFSVALLSERARRLPVSQSWSRTCSDLSGSHGARLRRLRSILSGGGNDVPESDPAGGGDLDLGSDQSVPAGC